MILCTYCTLFNHSVPKLVISYQIKPKALQHETNIIYALNQFVSYPIPPNQEYSLFFAAYSNCYSYHSRAVGLDTQRPIALIHFYTIQHYHLVEGQIQYHHSLVPWENLLVLLHVDLFIFMCILFRSRCVNCFIYPAISAVSKNKQRT